MRARDCPRIAIQAAIENAAEKERKRRVSLRLRGLINQIKCGKLPVSVLDKMESDYGDKWQMFAAARREVLGDS